MLNNISISPNLSLFDALSAMDKANKKLLLIIKNDKFIGLISIGDIQRAILSKISMETSIEKIMRKNIKVATPNDTLESIKKMIFKNRMEFCPVVDHKNNVISVYFWEDLFTIKKVAPRKKFNLPVIIMAGGYGSRLKPLTNVLPKPLIPIGDKSIIEEIMQRFAFHGSKQFYISINYKADLIEFYIKQQKLPYFINFFKEQYPMGTAGSLSLLRNKIHSTFIVTNCDILIDQDYSEILNYHYENKNHLTIVAVIKSYRLPYGIIETEKQGVLKNIREKPELTYTINSGMYILEPELLQKIPHDTSFHITDLISQLKDENYKIGVFPIGQSHWTDIGEWDKYSDIINIDV